MSQGATCFLQKTGNLFNVSITRARSALVVVGDKKAAARCEVEHMKHFARYTDLLQKRSGSNSRESERQDLGSEYPPVAQPELVSDWERRLYSTLYEVGLRPIPQYQVEKFLLDFALLAGERRLNIEVDGERYHRDWNGELLRRDQLRNMRLIELGWDVMRFWVYEIRDDMGQCVSRVLDWYRGVGSQHR